MTFSAVINVPPWKDGAAPEGKDGINSGARHSRNGPHDQQPERRVEDQGRDGCNFGPAPLKNY